MNRRGFLGAILAAGVAPAVVKATSLMRLAPLLPGGTIIGPKPRWMGVDLGAGDDFGVIEVHSRFTGQFSDEAKRVWSQHLWEAVRRDTPSAFSVLMGMDHVQVQSAAVPENSRDEIGDQLRSLRGRRLIGIDRA